MATSGSSAAGPAGFTEELAPYQPPPSSPLTLYRSGTCVLFAVDADSLDKAGQAALKRGDVVVVDYGQTAIRNVTALSAVRVRYQLGAGTLLRGFRGRGLPVGEQRVLQGVSSLHWSYYQPSLGWVDRWPPSPELTNAWPAAIAADIALAPGGTVGGTVRRVTLLPAQP